MKKIFLVPMLGILASPLFAAAALADPSLCLVDTFKVEHVLGVPVKKSVDDTEMNFSDTSLEDCVASARKLVTDQRADGAKIHFEGNDDGANASRMEKASLVIYRK